MADKHLLYSWHNMMRRCYKTTNPRYKDYGGRGITVCPKWHLFSGFLDDMANLYKEGLTLERINNDLGYSLINCKWATRKEQANNRRSSRFIIFNGVKKTMAQWAEYLNIKSSTLRQRFYVYKWDIDKCFNLGGQIG